MSQPGASRWQAAPAPGPAEPRRTAQSRAGPRCSRGQPQSPPGGREGPGAAEPGVDVGALRDGSRAGSQPGHARLKGSMRAGAQDGSCGDQWLWMRHREEKPATPCLRAQAPSRISAPLGLSLRSFQSRPGSSPPRHFPAMALLDVPCCGQAFASRSNLFRRGRIQRASGGAAAGRGAGSACRGANPPGSAAARPPHRPFPAPGAAAPAPASPGAPGGTRLTSPLDRSRCAGT